MSLLALTADEILEATVVGSFSRVGFEVRRRTAHWADPPNMDGKVVLLTGATSGLGLAAATRLAGLGASIRYLARNQERAEAAAASIIETSGNRDVTFRIADLSDMASVRSFAAAFRTEETRLDVVIHNAGVLSRDYETTGDGIELTVATQLVAPFLLTNELLALLRSEKFGHASRVVTVSSGGMYTERFDLSRLEMKAVDYDGVKAYARAKRAQLILNREWARRQYGSGIVFVAMHPGWADTPGIQTSLPAFRRVMRPLLRSPEQGADTIVWLAASPEATGGFWHDRRPRLEHKVPWTHSAGADTDGPALWDWCAERALS